MSRRYRDRQACAAARGAVDRQHAPDFVDAAPIFAILFGFGMGADYMLIPLMAAEQFGVNSLARAMAIILPTDTIGQTWFPYGVSWLREHYGNYGVALNIVFIMAAVGAIAVALLPGSSKEDEVLPIQSTQRAGS